MVWVKNLKYSYVFIFCKISQQNVFHVILQSEKAFLDYRYIKKVQKVKKTRIFPKGLVHGFGKKIGNFSMFIFLARSISKMCLTLFQKVTKRFQTIKNTKQKKSKHQDFSKGVQSMVLVKKFEIFPCFYFFAKNSQQNVFDDILDILESKKAFLKSRTRMTV